MSSRSRIRRLFTGAWALGIGLAVGSAQGQAEETTTPMDADGTSADGASSDGASSDRASVGSTSVDGASSDSATSDSTSADAVSADAIGADASSEPPGAGWAAEPSAPASSVTVPVDLSHALGEAALDLGILAQVVPTDALDEELERRPRTGAVPWLLAYRLSPAGDHWRIEITAVPPESPVRRVAVDVVELGRVEVRAMVLLRQAVRLSTERAAAPSTAARPEPYPPPRSTGRAVLALNTALLGGAIGVSLHKASSSEDNRLLYPLAALGVGIGLGASMLVADEWDITTDDAWFLSAGMVWPAVSGLALSAGYDVEEEHRYLYGLSGTAAGVTLAAIGIANGRIYEGSATLAHSGALFGLGMGALAEGIVRGDLLSTPLRGVGYGTGAGVLAAGILATQVETSSSRVLLIDLAALLGGLTGGAVATPLLLVDDLTDTHRRLWFGSIALGTGIGAVIGILATPSEQPRPMAESSAAPRLVERWTPQAGLIGFSEVGDRREPAFGAGVQGLW